MSVKFIFFIICLTFSSILFGQYDLEEAEKDSVVNNKNNKFMNALKENLYVGSGVNLLLGNRLYIYASPQIGYEFIPKVSAGFLSLFQYDRIQYLGGQSESWSTFGGGIFVRYRPFDFLVIESSFNLYKTNFTSTSLTEPVSYNAKSFMTGIGYTRSLGKKSYLNAILSYDFLNEQYNPEYPIFNTLSGFKLYYKFGIVIYPFN
ncbi:MAG: hypothetical protein AB8B74_09210 [Crocinitomicaceae bacterium]